MRHLWISLALLAAMSALLLYSSIRIVKMTEPMTDLLLQATAAAEEEDWSGAKELSTQVRARWENQETFLRLVLSHDDLDEIALLLREADQYMRCQDVSSYTASNMRVVGILVRMRAAEKFSAENLL